MPEQLELFGQNNQETPRSHPTIEIEDLHSLNDDELRSRLAKALRLLNVGHHYDVLADTSSGKRLTLDRTRVINLLSDPKAIEQEIAERFQESLQDRTSGPGGVD